MIGIIFILQLSQRTDLSFLFFNIHHTISLSDRVPMYGVLFKERHQHYFDHVAFPIYLCCHWSSAVSGKKNTLTVLYTLVRIERL